MNTINVNSKAKLNRILECLKRSRRHAFYEELYTCRGKHYIVFYSRKED